MPGNRIFYIWSDIVVSQNTGKSNKTPDIYRLFNEIYAKYI